MKKALAKSSWDAVLDTSMCDKYNNAELTITIKLGFKQINPAAGALTGTYAVAEVASNTLITKNR